LWPFSPGLTIYWVGLIAMLSISFCYHMTPVERLRPTLRRVDHATIFLKIAGTYTPFVLAIGSAFGYVILALVWVLARGRWRVALFRRRGVFPLGKSEICQRHLARLCRGGVWILLCRRLVLHHRLSVRRPL